MGIMRAFSVIFLILNILIFVIPPRYILWSLSRINSIEISKASLKSFRFMVLELLGIISGVKLDV